MEFDAEAYAEGISNSAAGSSIEKLVDTIKATIAYLDAYQATLAAWAGGAGEPDEALDIVRLNEKWTELIGAIKNNPDNAYLNFGDDEEEDEDEEIDYEHEIDAMRNGSMIEFADFPGHVVERKGDNHWVVRFDGDSWTYDDPSDVLGFLEA